METTEHVAEPQTAPQHGKGHKLPEAHMVHQTSGRARIKVPSRRTDEAYFLHASANLAKCGGVTRVEINAVTGSLLIHHSTDIRSICRYARQVGLFSVLKSRSKPMPLSQRWAGQLSGVNRWLLDVSGGQIDSSTLVVGVLIGAAGLEIVRGNYARVIPLLWFAGIALMLASPSTGPMAEEMELLAEEL